MVYELKYTSADLYIKSALFVAANILFPQLFHLFPGGGRMFLPIYFFTLIAAMRYGRQAGLLTALATPIIGLMLFGAPQAAYVPDMLLKGAVLVMTAWLFAKQFGTSWRASLAAVPTAWLIVGLMEWPFMGAAYAFKDFAHGLPGMLLMVVGSWAVNWCLDRRNA